MIVIMLRSLVAVSLVALSTGVVAQDVDESALDELDRRPASNPVVREVPGSVELRASMRRIAMSPGDADALADAGNAALTLGDANAALNFFTRASAIRPRDGRIISGLAAATVRTENPFEALRLFDDAVKLGVSERSIAADRALAFDLLGNFARAQQDYNLARSASSSPDLIIRQSISLSLSGQKNEADGMLVPLLQKNNPAAWRARAFMLAARGDYRESVKVTQGFMDMRSAQKMERYLRLMPDLTRAQQAAAIHLGHFPANNIGRDSENVRRVAANIPAAQPVGNGSRLIPSGKPLGQTDATEKPSKSEKKSDIRREREREKAEKRELERQAKAIIAIKASKPVKAANAGSNGNRDGLYTDTARAQLEQARTTIQTGVATVVTVRPGTLPPPEAARPLVKIALAEPLKTNVENLPASVPTTAAANTAVQGPTESGSPLTTAAPVDIRPSPVVVPPPSSASVTSQTPSVVKPATPAFDLAAIIGAITIPESEQKPSAVPVDLKKLKPAVPKVALAEAVKGAKVDPKAKEKASKANPARFWIQIATGEASALGYDYRRWAKKSPEVFKGQSGWTSAWGKTDRLLVGPFADLKASKKWEADFKKAGGNSFAWKSENGVVVTALKSK